MQGLMATATNVIFPRVPLLWYLQFKDVLEFQTSPPKKKKKKKSRKFINDISFVLMGGGGEGGGLCVYVCFLQTLEA